MFFFPTDSHISSLLTQSEGKKFESLSQGCALYQFSASRSLQRLFIKSFLPVLPYSFCPSTGHIKNYSRKRRKSQERKAKNPNVKKGQAKNKKRVKKRGSNRSGNKKRIAIQATSDNDSKNEKRQWPILPSGVPLSTFGVRKLNFCVRNGNRWDLSAIIAAMAISKAVMK